MPFSRVLLFHVVDYEMSSQFVPVFVFNQLCAVLVWSKEWKLYSTWNNGYKKSNEKISRGQEGCAGLVAKENGERWLTDPVTLYSRWPIKQWQTLTRITVEANVLTQDLPVASPLFPSLPILSRSRYFPYQPPTFIAFDFSHSPHNS